MRNFALLTVLALAACGQSKAPVTPVTSSDGGQGASCDPAAVKAASLYKQAAIDEGLAVNLHTDFVEANVHMVMVDCKSNPESVLRCVAQAANAAAVENSCLAPLDDDGEVEGRYFSKR